MFEPHSNARQISLALFEFETEYGTFPCDSTAADVTKAYPAHGFDLLSTVREGKAPDIRYPDL